MSIRSTLPPNPIEPGDLVMRKKLSGLGWHYGTGLSDGGVAHTMPETGKTVESVDVFGAGLLFLSSDLIGRSKRMQLSNGGRSPISASRI